MGGGGIYSVFVTSIPLLTFRLRGLSGKEFVTVTGPTLDPITGRSYPNTSARFQLGSGAGGTLLGFFMGEASRHYSDGGKTELARFAAHADSQIIIKRDGGCSGPSCGVHLLGNSQAVHFQGESVLGGGWEGRYSGSVRDAGIPLYLSVRRPPPETESSVAFSLCFLSVPSNDERPGISSALEDKDTWGSELGEDEACRDLRRGAFHWDNVEYKVHVASNYQREICAKWHFHLLSNRDTRNAAPEKDPSIPIRARERSDKWCPHYGADLAEHECSFDGRISKQWSDSLSERLEPQESCGDRHVDEWKWVTKNLRCCVIND